VTAGEGSYQPAWGVNVLAQEFGTTPSGACKGLVDKDLWMRCVVPSGPGWHGAGGVDKDS